MFPKSFIHTDHLYMLIALREKEKNVLSVLLVLVSIFSFIDHDVKNGVIELIAAFLLSPYGLPMIGAWLVAQLHLLRDWMKEEVYG